ncbi:glycosyltransferase family 4 protein [uncultured Algibacter sp.]|uniref:glycosyltransferase family 4 protein n=1 Tax=uncultured Algibacter sp. TaxID=298659 RepID=UPI002614833E|nr:glycosyltransferase family 4 protein [uncultured Algibacter sp.]
MRVLQLIDSLDTGGSERVAVNLANALSAKIEASFLCATRKEGLLKKSLFNEVGYLFLEKKKTIDLKAIRLLNRFIKENGINIIHAHSSSFFLAVIAKFFNKNLIVLWHDHYGNSEFLSGRKSRMLQFCSKYFFHVFSVNRALEVWAKQNLRAKNISYLPNFASVDSHDASTVLNGNAGKRIVCLANLRSQKDHITLLDAFNNVLKFHPEWTLHCVGKDFNDNYSSQVKSKIKTLNIDESVFIYGSKPDVFNILTQCEIGVLSSKSEGLPVALLEYGLSNLAVVATSVGEVSSVVDNNFNGLVVKALSYEELSEALIFYIENDSIRNEYATKFSQHVKDNFSEQSQLNRVLEVYNKATH